MSDTINYEFSTGPFKLVSPGPGSVEAYDSAAGSAGACLNDAVQNEIFRGHIPSFWSEVIPKIEKATGIARAVDEAATAKAKARAKEGAKVSDVLEKFTSYINRVLATDGVDKDAINAIARDTALALAIDPSPSRRAAGPGKLFLERADSLLALGDEKLEAKVGGMLTTVDFDLERGADGRPTRESLAGLIKTWFDSMSA